MRLAWFSPVPPERSGIATYTAEILPLLSSAHHIDCIPELGAHDFVWMHRRTPYDLVVYQLGNAPCHDYMWAYLAAYPGLVVLHDARLHHARARQLLKDRRFDDYRREFAYDHPDARPEVAEYAVEGLGGSIYYFWSMLRVVMRTARLVAVHNTRVADDLRTEYPGVAVETIRLGVSPIAPDTEARRVVRHALDIPDDAVVFTAFGKVTPEKRIPAILNAIAALRREGLNVWLLIVGDAGDSPATAADGVRATGYVSDVAVGAYLSAADACVCLRWPSALETSGSWLRCLAAARATVISDLPHLVDIPSQVALRVDLLNEERELLSAMRRLASDPQLRSDLGRSGREYWAAGHTLQAMAGDYERLLTAAAARPAPEPMDLPSHFVDDHSEPAREIARRFGVDVDVLRASAGCVSRGEFRGSSC
jgi:glycosyltransferase involved in cell wall biosynthesis